jgi:hypothetical protein
MNVQFRERQGTASSVDTQAPAKTAIADCDIHPVRATATELHPFLATRWHEHLEIFGKHPYQGMMEGPPYPKAQPNASRRDAYPPEGGPQGSSLSFMQQQHLDPNNVALGVLNPLATGQGIRNHGNLFGDQRLADQQMDQQGRAPEGFHCRRQRGWADRGRRNPQARR